MSNLFSGKQVGQSATQVSKLTPEQEQLIGLLAGQAAPAVRGVTGATIPGQEFAPLGASPLQQQAFDFAGGAGFGAFQQSLQPFAGGQFNQQVGGPLAAFANRNFQQNTIPSITGQAGAAGVARSSGLTDALTQAGVDLNLGLSAQLAPFAFGAQQSGLQRGFNAPQGIGGFAQLGAQQGAIPEAQRLFGLQQFQAGAPEADPRLGFLGPAFTSAFDTAVQQGSFQPSIFSQAAGPLATLAASDERVKENVRPIENALDKIKQLDGKTYNYIGNSEDNRNGGIMAQDLEKILPDAVSEIDGIKYVRYDAVVGLLINAVNELHEKIRSN